MLFAIYAIDQSDSPQKRNAAQKEHQAHLDNASRFNVKIVMSGPLLSDDGHRPVGSLIIVEAPGRAAVDAFNGADPYTDAGVWQKVDIRAYDKKRG